MIERSMVSIPLGEAPAPLRGADAPRTGLDIPGGAIPQRADETQVDETNRRVSKTA
jgi:hypothetical protein